MSEDRLIRLENLRKICAQRGLDARGLSNALGSRYTYWRDMLEGEKPSFGEKVARRIEEGLELPRGWLDADHVLEAAGTASATGSATLTTGGPLDIGPEDLVVGDPIDEAGYNAMATAFSLRSALGQIAREMLDADQTKREVVALLLRDIAVRPEALETTLGMLGQMIGVPDAAPLSTPAKQPASTDPHPPTAPTAAPELPANVHAIGEPKPEEIIGLIKTKEQKARYRATLAKTVRRK